MGYLERTELLVGPEAMARLAGARVIIFGVGGVGSWCAESLIRSGVGHLTMVDFDLVADSNVNRQLMAMSSTVGQPKVEVLRRRLLDINPSAEVVSVSDRYTADTAASFELDSFDYVIDCIDSLKDKALLILNACNSRAALFSSMGAALKLDPSRIRTGEFWEVSGDPLARVLRKRFHQSGLLPSKPFQCVFSDEVLENKGFTEVRCNGTMAYITAIFGLTLSSLVIRDIVK